MSGSAPDQPLAAAEATDDDPGLIEAGWRRDLDGLYVRRGARLVVLDAEDRVLLLRAHDVDEPARSWWFTVGGGIDPGEDARSAAVREAAEEVGLVLDPQELVGPVWRRSAVFDFARATCRQDEEFFVARVDAGDLRVDRATWTAIEQDTVDEVRWWDLADLASCRTQVYPEGLAALVSELVARRTADEVAPWDGRTVDLPAQRP